jgi:hypothetical protein
MEKTLSQIAQDVFNAKNQPGLLADLGVEVSTIYADLKTFNS